MSQDAASNLALTRTGRWNERPDGAGVSDVDRSSETHLFLARSRATGRARSTHRDGTTCGGSRSIPRGMCRASSGIMVPDPDAECYAGETSIFDAHASPGQAGPMNLRGRRSSAADCSFLERGRIQAFGIRSGKRVNVGDRRGRGEIGGVGEGEKGRAQWTMRKWMRSGCRRRGRTVLPPGPQPATSGTLRSTPRVSSSSLRPASG